MAQVIYMDYPYNGYTYDVGETETLRAWVDGSQVSSGYSSYKVRFVIGGSRTAAVSLDSDWYAEYNYTFKSSQAGQSVGIYAILCNASGSDLAVPVSGTVTVKVNAESETFRVRYCDGSSSSYTSYLESITLKKPSLSGWTFKGWATSTATKTTDYDAGEIVYPEYDGQTLTLYAVYTKESTMYCYYGVNQANYYTRTKRQYRWQTGTTSYSTSNYDYITMPTLSSSDKTITTSTPSRTWTFLGWRTDTVAGTESYSEGWTANPASVSAYYAVYSNTVSIAYNSNGGSGSMSASSGTAYYNSSGNYTTPTIELRDCSFTPPSGKTFDAWCTSSDGTGTTYSSTITTNYNLTLYAIWLSGRPSNWSWTSTVSKGAEMRYTKVSDKEYKVYPLTASEWNSFIDRIFEFINYCGLSVSGGDASNFYVTKGTTMTATQVDYARQLISSMNPPTALPSAIGSGGRITAAYINGLKNSLNSIE